MITGEGLDARQFNPAHKLRALGLDEGAIDALGADFATDFRGMLALHGGLADGSREAIGGRQPSTVEPLRFERTYHIGRDAAGILIDGQVNGNGGLYEPLA